MTFVCICKCLQWFNRGRGRLLVKNYKLYLAKTKCYDLSIKNQTEMWRQTEKYSYWFTILWQVGVLHTIQMSHIFLLNTLFTNFIMMKSSIQDARDDNFNIILSYNKKKPISKHIYSQFCLTFYYWASCHSDV